MIAPVFEGAEFGGAIERGDQEKVAQRWREGMAKRKLFPGVVGNEDDLTSDLMREEDRAAWCAMVAWPEAGQWLSSALGPAGLGMGSGGERVQLHCLMFEGWWLIAATRVGTGTTWYVEISEQDREARGWGRVESSQDGKGLNVESRLPALNSWSEPVRGFWPRFCQHMGDAMASDPAEFVARAESRALGRSLTKNPEASKASRL